MFLCLLTLQVFFWVCPQLDINVVFQNLIVVFDFSTIFFRKIVFLGLTLRELPSILPSSLDPSSSFSKIESCQELGFDLRDHSNSSHPCHLESLKELMPFDETSVSLEISGHWWVGWCHDFGVATWVLTVFHICFNSSRSLFGEENHIQDSQLVCSSDSCLIILSLNPSVLSSSPSSRISKSEEGAPPLFCLHHVGQRQSRSDRPVLSIQDA
jgi:hypothetical protein